MSAGQRVLIAGIGNIFLGDDGFGPAVVNRLDPAALPDGVAAVDYGIRGVHLAYDLLDEQYDTLIMVDAIPFGDDPPGALDVFEIGTEDTAEETEPQPPNPAEPLGAPGVDAHAMHPDAVLGVLESLGGRVDRILVLGCRPAAFDGGMQLSEPVRAAVDAAVPLLIELARTEAVRDSSAPQPIQAR
jgi:hydrogenase maturation protease